MQRFLIPLILLVCLNASADRVLETTDLKNTCWITQPELVFKDRHAVFIFRDDGTGERRGFSHGGWRGTSALNWNINNGVLGYTFQEPQAGYNPVSYTHLDVYKRQTENYSLAA